MTEYDYVTTFTIYFEDGSTDKIYHSGEDEVKESIESWEQSLYYGDCVKFKVEYEKPVDGKLIRHTEVLTEYGEEPQITEEEVNEFVELRESIGKNQKEFARFTGIPFRTIQNWENGVNTCPGYVLAMLKTCVANKETWHSEYFMNDYARKMRR